MPPPAPFRQDALALSATEAGPVLAKWDAEKMPLDLQLALLVLGGQYTPIRGSEGIGGQLTGAAEGLGFKYLGRFRFAGLIPFFGPAREAWTDRDGLVRVSLRRAIPHGPVEASMGPYILTTMFDDGTAITTWSRQLALRPSTLVTNRFGTGDLVSDYDAHRAAVAEHASEARRPLYIPDLATALAISTHYDRRITPWAIIDIVKARGVVLLLLVLTIAIVISTLRP